MPKKGDRIILDDAYGNSITYHFLGICKYKQMESRFVVIDLEKTFACVEMH